MLIAMLDHPDLAARDLSSLRVVCSGGAPVPAELVRRVERTLGCPVLDHVRHRPSARRSSRHPASTTHRRIQADTLGAPLPHAEVKIADPETGRPCPLGAVGELCARGYLVMLGYFDDARGHRRRPRRRRLATTPAIWPRWTSAATSAIEGRLKDMIIRGGENIYPREIEDVLFQAHPAVAEVAVVGQAGPDVGRDRRGVRPAGPDTTEAELHAYCRAHLAAYKTPTTWVFVDTFPLTASGKVRKNVLREPLADGPPPDVHASDPVGTTRPGNDRG